MSSITDSPMIVTNGKSDSICTASSGIPNLKMSYIKDLNNQIVVRNDEDDDSTLTVDVNTGLVLDSS